MVHRAPVLKEVEEINHGWVINREIIQAGKERDLISLIKKLRVHKGLKSLILAHLGQRNLSNKRNLNQ